MTEGSIASFVPTKDDIAAFYDNSIPLINQLVGNNVHVGYWTSSEDRSSLQKATDRMTDIVIERLAVKPGARVLDVGCGLGAPAIRLAKAAGVHVVGIATSPKLIDEAREAAQQAGLADQVTFEVVDAEEMDYPDESFDAVMAIESLVHMNDRPRAFGRIARVLRPGGRLVLTDRVEIATPTEQQREVVEAYRRLSMNSPFLKLDEYIRFLIEARLLPVEYRDITPETMAHQLHLLEAIEQETAGSATSLDPAVLSAGKSVFTGLFEARLPTNMLIVAERG
ncbi:methyltransferase domain-containing protein [Streptomyces sp. CB01881]|uniref:SAM-dependent methyltransferase n=1 Tax=Streptomyces sp. CB01881 TaxID=2078691 RepID=UPI000CDCB2AC|nr:methyltransferase domain-containing protein [Streptomyces sp. CB01881]AUY53117.1 SAM-dependent methyltransferase [Streptomyces sp. CB01881]TYC69269.1 methyltransferase domain-containing protein [Streptomyces sp. CB01881]